MDGTRKRRKKKSYSLDKWLEDLRKYNEKNGTYLSYGKFRALKEMGKIKE